MSSPSGPPLDTEGAPGAVLVVDDERNIRRTLQLVLEGDGYRVFVAETGAQALASVASPETPVDLVVLDIKLPDMSGLEVLERLRKDEGSRDLPVIVISGHASGEDAAGAIKLGASDFFEKPLVRDRVLVGVRNLLETARARRALASARRDLSGRWQMVGQSPAMQRVFREIEKVAPTRASVLIIGESGTGKELIARAIHRASPRAEAPFVKVNCAAIPRELVESELFGHEKGAFTGAVTRTRGTFEQAHGGTLFLDEIGDMDAMAQAKVLRAVQSGEIFRVGSEHAMHVDVRLLAATNKDLAKEVARGAFREDLYFRLAVFPIASPPLRERAQDLPMLVSTFLDAFCMENGAKPKPMDPDVVAALARRRWPGNVRELKNVVERMAILSGDRVTIADLPEDPHESPWAEDGPAVEPGDDDAPPQGERPSQPTSPAPGVPVGYLALREYRDQAERSYIVQTLRLTGWNISRTAVILGVERTNLHKKIRAYDIKREGR